MSDRKSAESAMVSPAPPPAKQPQRRSLPSRAAKRQAASPPVPEPAEAPPPRKKSRASVSPSSRTDRMVLGDEVEASDHEQEGLIYKWLDAKGIGPGPKAGSTKHEQLEIRRGNSQISQLKVGDCILLRSQDEEEAVETGVEDYFVARVEEMWEESPRSKRRQKLSREQRMKFKARWYFKKEDIKTLKGNSFLPKKKDALSVTSQKQLLSYMVDGYDLILSDQNDENDVLTILTKCNIIQRRPDDSDDALPAKLPPSTFRCRFSVEFESNKILVSPYQGENEEWPPGTEEAETDKEKTTKEKVTEVDVVEESSKSEDNKKEIESEDREAEKSSDAPEKEIEVAADIAASPDKKGQGAAASSVKKGQGAAASSDKKAQGAAEEMKVEAEISKVASIVDPAPANNESPVLTDDGEFLTTDDDDNASFNSIESHGRGPETEGSNTKGSIVVGPEHQAVVPDWIPDSVPSKPESRNPTLIWSSENKISPQALQEYMEEACKVLTPHLQEKGLLIVEVQDDESETFRGLSEISTTSSVAGFAGSGKLASVDEDEEAELPWKRECNVDALLEVLNESDSVPSAAIEKIKGDPEKFVTSWTKKERDLFNSGFRRFSGSLRMIGKGLQHAGKTHKDVVDYYYRFKIPQQFRLYQEQKRRQAIAMMETIDKRTRSAAASADASGSISPSPAAATTATAAATPKIQNWSRVSVNDVMHSTDERTRQARELLTEVHTELGMDKLHQISEALQAVNAVSSARGVSASSADVRDLKTIAVELLSPTPALLAKFLDFLPRQYRAC